mmetsp:Transcript_31598/g.64959  ORF Transcript_31598/g.64959 Transcript_31598/m.64959 type:complete len:309 (-) Transcript_31598:60-986(-)
MMRLIIAALLTAPPAVVGFQTLPGQASHHSRQSSSASSSRALLSRPPTQFPLFAFSNDGDNNNYHASPQTSKSSAELPTRRNALLHVLQTTLTLTSLSPILLSATPSHADIEGVVPIPQSTAPPTSTSTPSGVTLFKTKSGLQYIDLVEGTGPSPQYGNFVTISYKAYIKLPDVSGKPPSKLDEFDSDEGYLIKHGNGRTIPGLDEGLHTMRVGGIRRIIIPPKLGYVTSGLGPIPVGPYGRWKLNRLLDRMVELKGGNVVMDVVMRGVAEDEADQGYYEDESLTPEEFDILRGNIEGSQQRARAAKQ